MKRWRDGLAATTVMVFAVGMAGVAAYVPGALVAALLGLNDGLAPLTTVIVLGPYLVGRAIPTLTEYFDAAARL